jgi:hypothetical protein
MEKLFKNYNYLERPIENDKNTLNVAIDLSVQQIVDIVYFFLLIHLKYK